MSLSIERVDNFVEAHEITDEWQILAIACPIWVCECSSNDVAKFANVAHVKATHIGIKRKSPAHGSVCLLLRGEKAHKILVVARRDDERMMREPGFLHDPINLGLAGKVGNVELAAADRFYIRQRGPDKVFNPCILGSAYRRPCLLELIGTFFPEIGDQKDAICAFECSFECFRAVQISFDDLVGELPMLVWIAGQGAHLEFAAGLQGTYNSASLLSRCTDHGD